MATSLSQPIRVVIVDDHVVVRTGLRMLIESQPGIMVVGEAGNSAEALAVVAHTQPDIIVLDARATSLHRDGHTSRAPRGLHGSPESGRPTEADPSRPQECGDGEAHLEPHRRRSERGLGRIGSGYGP